MPPEGSELAFKARARPQNHASDGVATGICTSGLAEGKTNSDLTYSMSDDTFQQNIITP
jgi:hypothetical protein